MVQTTVMVLLALVIINMAIAVVPNDDDVLTCEFRDERAFGY